jgi:hypothetical protein
MQQRKIPIANLVHMRGQVHQPRGTNFKSGARTIRNSAFVIEGP